jgi:hypothetical protein
LITLTYGDQGPKRKAYSRCYWDPLPTFAWPAMAQQTAKNTTPAVVISYDKAVKK